MTKFFSWIILSSRDSEKVSLTVKAFFTGLITVATILAGLSHITLPGDTLTAFADAGVTFVQAILLVVSSIATLYGLARKLWTSFRGTNAVINNPQI